MEGYSDTDLAHLEADDADDEDLNAAIAEEENAGGALTSS